MGDESTPWTTAPFVATVVWVKTQDGREIPLRYTETNLPNEMLRVVVEIWHDYPNGYGQLVFRHEERS